MRNRLTTAIRFDPADLSSKRKSRAAKTWILWVMRLANFGLTSIAQAANYYAVGETPVVGTKGASGKWCSTYTSTHAADGIGQQLYVRGDHPEGRGQLKKINEI